MISGLQMQMRAPKRENKACTPVDATLLCYKLIYTLTPSPAVSEQSLRDTWDAPSRALSPKIFPPNEVTLYF